MNIEIIFLSIINFWNLVTCTTNSTTKRTIEDDYYLNYDYDIPNNSDSLLMPNPENLESKYTVDVLPNVELPDDSLADTDLKDHDFIDNLMYVYYGSHSKNDNSYGSELIIVGSVLSCAAQLLTICFVLLKKNLNGRKEMKHMFLHLMGSYCLSNLLFMLGIYATKNKFKCLVIAFLLNYLHLVTAFWLLIYCCYIYKKFLGTGSLKAQYLIILGYTLPMLLSLLSYLLTPYSFETKRFCFLSAHKGMITNYMLPVSILIIYTTIYSLNGIRKINIELSKLEFNSSAESINIIRNELDMLNNGSGNVNNRKQEVGGFDEEVVSLRESKTCLKLLCLVQTSYGVVWFIVVIALENSAESNSMSIVYFITSCLLNWYIFFKAKSFLPCIAAVKRNIDEVIARPEEKSTANNITMNGSSDSIPLLISNENCTEMRELRLDYISTISS